MGNSIEAIHGEFGSIDITRRGGDAGTQRIFVGPDMRAWVATGPGVVHHLELDAYQSEELLRSMAALAKGTGTSSEGGATTPPTYDLELTWGGETHRFATSQLATDEALHGVVGMASNLLDHGVHAVPHEDRGTNPGIVPPWLQGGGRNPGIVPPWLQTARETGADTTEPIVGEPDPDTPRIMNDNGGIVPPWLQ